MRYLRAAKAKAAAEADGAPPRLTPRPVTSSTSWVTP